MLGEDHSLLADFPELSEKISERVKTDDVFAKNNKKYTALDKEIRTLELKGGPIDDVQINQMKHERAALKDALYQKLLS